MIKRAKVEIEDLAALIAKTTKGVKPVSPKLRLVETPKETLFDSITRMSVLARIRRLSRAYQLQWLVEQSTFNKASLDSLEDAELSALLQDMEKGRECIVDGIPFDDVGLVRSTIDLLPAGLPD